MFHILCIDHLVLRVTSLPFMQAFYCGVLGCTIEGEEADPGLIQLRAGSSLIDLVPVASGRLQPEIDGQLQFLDHQRCSAANRLRSTWKRELLTSCRQPAQLLHASQGLGVVIKSERSAAELAPSFRAPT